MKRLFLIASAILLAITINAQDSTAVDTLWKFNGFTSLNLSQLSLTN